MTDPEAELVQAVAPLWSMERTRAALGLIESQVTERMRDGSLLGLECSDGSLVFPLAQFETHDGTVRVRPALVQFLGMLRDEDPWTVALVLVTAADELDGDSPVDWTRDGRDIEALLDYATTLRTPLHGRVPPHAPPKNTPSPG